MRLLKSVLTSRLCLLALAASLLPLTSCSSARTKPPLDLPAIKQQPPAKPVAAMQHIQPPDQPTAVSSLPKEQQAQAAALLYAGAVEVAGKCLRSRDTLIQWIKDH